LVIYKNFSAVKAAKRIGILGGAFDPVHYGHMAAAEAAKHKLNLDIVLFMPTGNPPHKEIKTMAEHRYLMAVLAAAESPDFYVSLLEVDNPKPSYTIDTIRALKKESRAELYFIMGADEMMQILNWRDSRELLGLCKWAVATRSGCDTKKLDEYTKHLMKKYNCEITMLKMPSLALSGTEIRRRASRGKTIKYMIPSFVEGYIKDLDLYNSEAVGLYEKILHKVKAALSPKRFKHTLGVTETVVMLAARHGTNMRHAFLAGLLHDYAKELHEDKKRLLCQKYDIPLDEIQNRNITLMHGYLSASLANDEFGIDDADIIEAISYHTTGRENMCLLEKLLKVADNTEPMRPNYAGLDEIKSLALSNIDRACAASIKRDLEYTKTKGRELHPLSLEALNFLKGE